MRGVGFCGLRSAFKNSHLQQATGSRKCQPTQGCFCEDPIHCHQALLKSLQSRKCDKKGLFQASVQDAQTATEVYTINFAIHENVFPQPIYQIAHQETIIIAQKARISLAGNRAPTGRKYACILRWLAWILLDHTTQHLNS